MKPYVDSGLAELVQGDALSSSDMTRAWTQAALGGPVDVIQFTLGSTEASFSFTKGFTINPPDLCTAALLNTLATFPNPASTSPPRLIITSAFGVTKATHKALSLSMRTFYSTIKGPHDDKMGMETICGYSAGWTPAANEHKPSEKILPAGWDERLPQKGWLKHAVILRPAFYTDGKMTGKYRVGDDTLSGVYIISRRDVAHFIVTDLLANWEKYDGKGVSIAY